jgi:hypothetical protein
MILEKQSQSTVLQEGEQTQESIGMSLDLDSAQVLMQMLSKNLYSDSIGSTIRECASNALDSHRRAGITDPIVVSFRPNKDNNYEFSVEDFGTGLDADDVKNIISKYGKSTKRDSNTELGMMGLGFKAPLAYCSSFYFTCRKNGVERKYMMYEGEEVNTIDLLYEKPTTERNGVKIIIPVGWRDRHQFTSKINEQLAYFESVYFDVENMSNDDVVIMRHDDFQWSSLASNSDLHICLDNVYYPIDFGKLDMSNLRFPIALRFKLTDGLFPTPNRESLRYTREAKDVIMKKLAAVADFFVNKYNETVQDTDDIFAAMDYFRKSDRYISGYDGGNLNVNVLRLFSTVAFATPKVKGLNYETAEFYNRIREYALNEYEIKHEVSGGKIRQPYRYHNIGDMWQKDTIYIYEDRIPGVKKDYLRSISNRNNKMFIVKKNKPFKLMSKGGSYDSYNNILSLSKHPKTEWRERIKEFQYVQSLMTKNILDLDKFEVPQHFIDARKKTSLKVVNGVATSGPVERRKKLEGEVTGKMAYALERTVFGQYSKYVSETIQMKTAHQLSYLMVYGGSGHSVQMDRMYSIFPTTTKFMVFSERELTRLKEIDLHNWIHIDDFMKGNNIVFKRAVTSALIYKFKRELYRPVFDKMTRMTYISTDIHDKMQELVKYSEKYYLHGNQDLLDSMIKLAEENNLFDESIYSTYNEIKGMFDSLPFINPVFQAAPNYTTDKDAMTDVICDLFKYYKQRIDWKNYNIKLNEEVVTPIVEDSQIEELI